MRKGDSQILVVHVFVAAFENLGSGWIVPYNILVLTLAFGLVHLPQLYVQACAS